MSLWSNVKIRKSATDRINRSIVCCGHLPELYCFIALLHTSHGAHGVEYICKVEKINCFLPNDSCIKITRSDPYRFSPPEDSLKTVTVCNAKEDQLNVNAAETKKPLTVFAETHTDISIYCLAKNCKYI